MLFPLLKRRLQKFGKICTEQAGLKCALCDNRFSRFIECFCPNRREILLQCYHTRCGYYHKLVSMPSFCTEKVLFIVISCLCSRVEGSLSVADVSKQEGNMRILIAEDHPSLGVDLKQGMEQRHYAVDLVTDGEDALSLALAVPYDLLVLDVLLPSLNGFEACRRLRAQQRTIPVLFLTALNAIEDRVTGLNIGGDDYLTKPFSFREFEARVRALLRRDSEEKSAQLRFLDLTLDTRSHEVRRGKRLIPLSSKEYALLELFLRHPRQVLSRTMISEHIWNLEAEHFSNIIDVYVRYLRSKLCAEDEPDLIQTIRGSGYQLKEPL